MTDKPCGVVWDRAPPKYSSGADARKRSRYRLQAYLTPIHVLFPEYANGAFVVMSHDAAIGFPARPTKRLFVDLHTLW
jgi:hypothetical protein